MTVQRVDIPTGILDKLLAALLITSLVVFALGNALLSSKAVLLSSSAPEIVCLGILALLCAATRLLRNPAWALCLCYALVVLTVYGYHPLTVPFFVGLMVLAVVYLAMNLRLPLRELRSAAGMSLVASFTILGTRSAYTSFDMIARLRAGNVSLDTLYHASIAAMIKNYGVTSTGLNGLVETPYHALSHAMFGAISLISGSPVIEVYGVAPWALFAPILIFATALCCLTLWRGIDLKSAPVWYAICAILSVAPGAFNRWALWDSYFVSESYLVALSLFLLTLPLLVRPVLRARDVVLLTAAGAVLCACKAPVGVTYVGLLGVRALFIVRDRWQLRECLALLVVAATAVLVVFHTAVSNMTSVWFGPLQFVEQYSFLGGYLREAHEWLEGGPPIGWREIIAALIALGSFIAFHFFVSWIVLLLALRHCEPKVALRSPIVVLSLGAVFAGACIVALFRIFGGSAYYFTNMAFIVSLPPAAASLALLFSRLKPSQPLVLVLVSVLVLAIGAGGLWGASALSADRAVAKQNALIERLLQARRTTAHNVILEPTKAALQSNPFSLCIARPFVFPAVSERPWSGVIVDGPDCEFEDYGYENYLSPGSTDPQSPRWPFKAAPKVTQLSFP